jgi:hypothetical protein
MTKRNRDDFSEPTKRALAYRANHRCSFPECGKPTSGPSDESPDKHVNIGVAAHIYAAAPGGPRSAPEMLPEERAAITNGLWLCQTHSKLIDADQVRFTADVLKKMKTDHEALVLAELEGRARPLHCSDFIALGPNLVFTGELIGSKDATWEVRIDHFLIGELTTLIDYCEDFDQTALVDRFVLVNALGDGRQLAASPAWQKLDASYRLSIKVRSSVPRIDAHNLPLDLALDSNHDIFMKNGDLATVSGLDALPQKISTSLSTQRGELLFSPTFGTRIREYFELFINSPWLPHLLKLEVIRMACIPVDVGAAEQPYTALRCVSRVRSIERLQSEQETDWIPFRLHLDVQGVGPWDCELPIHIPVLSLNGRPGTASISLPSVN